MKFSSNTRELAMLIWAGLISANLACLEPRRPSAQELDALTSAPWRMSASESESLGTATVVVDWWRRLNDPEFTALAEQALHSNLDLAIARERILEAQARRGVTNAQLLPQVDLSADYIHAGLGDDALSSELPIGGLETNLYAAGVVAGWEVDLWGRVQRMVDAADADASAAVEDYRAAAVSLLAELALAYADARTLDDRLALTVENVALQERTAELAQSRYQAGNGAEVEVSQANRLLRRTRSRLPELQRAKTVAETRIAILLGRRPADDVLPPGELPQAELQGGMGLPAELLTRRADVRQAAASYLAALARVDAADRERLPKLTLSGSFRMAADEFTGLFNESFFYSIGPQVSVPLFDGYRIDANIAMRTSQAEQARLNLERTLLQAIGEVENAVAGYVRKREQTDELELAVAAARKTATLTDQLYSAGLSSMMQSIDAQRELVAVEDELATTRQQAWGQMIQLYRALGGGWELMDLDQISTARPSSMPDGPPAGAPLTDLAREPADVIRESTP